MTACDAWLACKTDGVTLPALLRYLCPPAAVRGSAEAAALDVRQRRGFRALLEQLHQLRR